MNKMNWTVEDIIGDPARLDMELQAFRKDTDLLSSEKGRLITKYSKRWIAIYDGEVRADAQNLNEILDEVDVLQLPRNSVVIRYIDRNVKRMIL